MALQNTAAPLLSVSGLEVAYGKAQVVHGVDFVVRPGEFAVLLGRNGAGKSTIVQALTGLITKRAGHIAFDGQDITRLSPRAILQKGLVHVLEGHRVFTGLSVEDNLLLGGYARKSPDPAAKLELVYAEFPEIAGKRHELASSLSGGQQQILAVAQGIMADPRLLILDEPSGGLAPIVVDKILAVGRRLADQGMAILLIEQMVEKALKHADHGYLLETGRIELQGSAAELRASDDLRRIYLGAA